MLNSTINIIDNRSLKQIKENMSKSILSQATTANMNDEQLIRELRKKRIDAGKKRSPYNTKNTNDR